MNFSRKDKTLLRYLSVLLLVLCAGCADVPAEYKDVPAGPTPIETAQAALATNGYKNVRRLDLVNQPCIHQGVEGVLFAWDADQPNGTPSKGQVCVPKQGTKQVLVKAGAATLEEHVALRSTLLMYVAVAIFGGIGALILLFGSLFTISQGEAGIIERLGRFNRTVGPGLHIKWPFFEQIDHISMQVLELTDDKGHALCVETKTKDNVSVSIDIAVQYFVIPGKEFDAHYKLHDPESQFASYIFDVVRGKVPSMTLDEVFEDKDAIATQVKLVLTDAMDDYGYGIKNVLVVDVDQDEKVKTAMNEINAATRMRQAAAETGEANKILKVKAAEAEAESKALQGEGIARQRKALVDGLRESVTEFQESVSGVTSSEVMQLVMLTQYLDTMKDIGESGNATTILLPHSPGAMGDLHAQIRDAMIVAGKTNT